VIGWNVLIICPTANASDEAQLPACVPYPELTDKQEYLSCRPLTTTTVLVDMFVTAQGGIRASLCPLIVHQQCLQRDKASANNVDPQVNIYRCLLRRENLAPEVCRKIWIEMNGFHQFLNFMKAKSLKNEFLARCEQRLGLTACLYFHRSEVTWLSRRNVPQVYARSNKLKILPESSRFQLS
jgi:hypothetical protein